MGCPTLGDPGATGQVVPPFKVPSRASSNSPGHRNPENWYRVSAGKSRRQISFLCAKARHHTSSIDKADGHLKRLKQDNREERIYIWADLAKVARQQGVWDVCRTACRFCLLYDVMAKKMSRTRKGVGRKKKGGPEVILDVLSSSELMLSTKIMTVDIQRTFAKVGFINAEAIIHFLQSEGIALNDRPVPPESSVQHHTGNIAVPPEEDAEWLTYRQRGRDPSEPWLLLWLPGTPWVSQLTDSLPLRDPSASFLLLLQLMSQCQEQLTRMPSWTSPALPDTVLDLPGPPDTLLDLPSPTLNALLTSSAPQISSCTSLPPQMLSWTSLAPSDTFLDLLGPQDVLLDLSGPPDTLLDLYGPPDTLLDLHGLPQMPSWTSLVLDRSGGPRLSLLSWIENLSQYVQRNWLRSAEIGQEINEAWLVHNTVVYVLNHNHHLITAGRQRELVDLLQNLLNIMRITGHNGDTVALVLLCNALARGLILPWIPSHTSDRGRRFLKSTQTHVAPLEWNAISEVKVAIEVCDFGLTLTNGNLPQEIVPISIRQQLIATWVKAKQLVQQQIGNKLGTDEENLNESQVRMTKVLVALEMYSCNGLGLMDFTLPTLAQMLKMASECVWTDPLMEIQSLVRLAHFAYMLREHESVMALCKKVLSKGEKLLESQREVKCSDQNDNLLPAELLSALLCTQGKSIMENLAGRKQLRQQAAKAFLGSIRYAGLAGNHTLVMQSARHYWNTCLPFFSSSFCRKKLKQSIQLILKTISKTENKEQCKERSLILHQWPSMDLQYSGSTEGHFQSGTDDDITLKTALYGLLYHMHADQNDLQGGLRVLEEAIQVLPRTGHRLFIFKHMVMVKAKLGQNFSMEVQKFKDTSEDYLSHMWHCLAFSSKDLLGSLYCYYNAIHALQKPENTWKKIDYLMEFSEWLYYNQFPINNVFFHLNWAIDLLLSMKTQNSLIEETGVSPIPMEDAGVEEDSSVEEDAEKTSSNQEELLQESSEAAPKVTLDTLTSVRQLETLAYAHTLMALVVGSGSSQYEENSLMAYRYIMRIWEPLASMTLWVHIMSSSM
ncbi:cilia- and flagella-associated protein 46-like [Trichosurus vulpecula]|uniref:cilia- and flagella-associated protein 46-like n=1 Tax=Trichosurus vulpecula TaxID=9337 RepID=UPI00186AFAEC|nr:cilia- and flagella-associated protein 46-like [Trichosurus vulpecula]